MPDSEKTVRYTPTRGDIFAFLIRAILRNRLLMGILAVALFFCIYMELQTARDATSTAVTPASAVKILSAVVVGILRFLPGLGLMLAILWFIIWRASRRGALTEQTLSITNEGFGAKSAAGEKLHKWSSIDRVVSTRRHLIIYWNQSMATIVPKRSFPSPAEAAAFEQEIRQRMKRARE